MQFIYVPNDVTTACPDDIEVTCEERSCINEGLQGFANATVIDQLIIDGITVDVKGYADGGIPRDVVIFNSDVPTFDPDLGTPNVLYGGPGVNEDDPNGENPTNNQSWGNMLIITQNGTANDAFNGDSLVFEFSEPVLMNGITLIDVDDLGAKVKVFDADGNVIDVISVAGGESNQLDEVVFHDYPVSKLTSELRNIRWIRCSSRNVLQSDS